MVINKYKKIMVVDDDEVHNFVTQKLIHQFDKDCTVTTFSNPEKGLYFLQHASLADLPEVLFLDINMPAMSGFDFLEIMNKTESLEKIQVIMYSSSTYDKDKNKAKMFSNVIGYMEKPFSPERYGQIMELGFVA